MSTIKSYWIDQSWEKSFEELGLLNIEALGRREFDWFEAPNRRRGGWSGVTRIELKNDKEGPEKQSIFFKIQKNHHYISWRNCFRKKLTYSREFDAIKTLDTLSCSMPDVVFFANWIDGDGEFAAIASQSLNGWLPFNLWLKENTDEQSLKTVLSAIANSLRPIHASKWAHFGLFPKHIFLKQEIGGNYRIKLIDLEKARQTVTLSQCIIEDVSRFLRHTTGLNREAQIHFLKVYFETDHFSSKHKSLIRKMRGAPQI